MTDEQRKQIVGFVFGVGLAVAVAVGLEIYNSIATASDEVLLELGFWRNVAVGVGLTAIRSFATAVAVVVGWKQPGVS